MSFYVHVERGNVPFTKTLGPRPVVRLDTRIIHEWRPFAWLYLYSLGLARFGMQIGHDEPSTA